MKTSLSNLKEIDRYLLKEMEPGEATLFNAKLILDPHLREQMQWQIKTHTVVRSFGRRQLLNEINAVHDRLFTEPKYNSFREKIKSFFTT